jgi:hypothetical protein
MRTEGHRIYIKVPLSVILAHIERAENYKYGLFNDETYEDHLFYLGKIKIYEWALLLSRVSNIHIEPVDAIEGWCFHQSYIANMALLI